MRLLFFGAPGVGKGTQSKIISEKMHIKQISTGEMLRAAVKENSMLGKKVSGYLNDGKLVPDDLIIDIISIELKKPDNENGFILDGFPRTLPQAEGLDKMFEKLDIHLDKVVEISVPDEIIIKRLVNRRICSECGNEYNLLYNPIPGNGKCEKCGNHIFIHRSDDHEETIRKRLAIYNEQTKPLMGYYQKKGLLFSIKGDHNIDAVTDDILKLFDM